MKRCRRLLATILLVQTWLLPQTYAIVLPDSSNKPETSTAATGSSEDELQDRAYHVSSIQDIIQRYNKQPSAFVVADYLAQGREADTTNVPKGRILDEAQVIKMITNSGGRQAGVGPPYGFYDRRLLDSLLAKVQGAHQQANPSYESYAEPSSSLRHYDSLEQQLQQIQLQQLKQQQILQEQQQKLQQQLRIPEPTVVTRQPQGRTVEHVPYGLVRLPLGVQRPQFLDAVQVMAGLQMLANIQHNLYTLSTAASEHRSRELVFQPPPTGIDPLLALLLRATVSPPVAV